MSAHKWWRIYVTDIGPYLTLTIIELDFRSAFGGPPQAVGGVSLASSQMSSRRAEHAFDQSLATFWQSANVGPPFWLEYQFTEPIGIVEYALFGGTGGGPFVMKDWEIQYSDDGANWATADVRAGQSLPAQEWIVYQLEAYQIQGIAKFSDGAVADIVRMSDHATGEHLADVTPGALDGVYTLGSFDPGPYDIAILRDDYRPLMHGPVTAVLQPA